jgi:hypothetical protein
MKLLGKRTSAPFTQVRCIDISMTKFGEFSPFGRLLTLRSYFKYFPNFWVTYVGTFSKLVLAEKNLGYILGDFFTNSSGHPD